MLNRCCRQGYGAPEIFLADWVTVSPKFGYQLEAMRELGFSVTASTRDYLGDSRSTLERLDQPVELIVLPQNTLRRIFSVLARINCLSPASIVLLPVASATSWIYLVAARLKRLKVVAIEWGDIGELETLPRARSNSMKFCYRYSHVVWYKEPYMEALLLKFRARSLHFLPNATHSVNKENNFEKRDRSIHFLWLNRVVPKRRNALTFARAANYLATEFYIHSVLVGLLNDSLVSREVRIHQDQLRSLATENFSVLGFADPASFYSQARYFVLFADEVFGNNALLEAMAAGCVPVVNNAPFVEKIVLDGVNGFVWDPATMSAEDFLMSLSELPQEDWIDMSRAASATVSTDFSVDGWRNNFRSLIERLRYQR